MTARASLDAALAAALDAMVTSDPDIADVLAHLVADCAACTSAGAVALLAMDSNESLSLLSATSHRAAEIEMLQIQSSTGPCVDCIATGELVDLAGADALTDRWGEVGTRIVEAGFDAVQAFPMRWKGEALGGLNLFRSATVPPAPVALGQAFADMATLVIVQSGVVTQEQVHAQLHHALSARLAVERAKGVLAYVEDLDPERAYAELLRRAEAEGASLTQTADDIVRLRGRPDP